MILASPSPVRDRDLRRAKLEVENRILEAYGDVPMVLDYDEEDHELSFEDMKKLLVGHFYDPRDLTLFIELLKESPFDIERYYEINEIGVMAYKALINIKKYETGKDALIVHGDSDYLPNQSYDALKDVFHHIKEITIRDCGHMVPVEKKVMNYVC